MLKILLLICVISAVKCNSYDWKKGLKSDKTFDFKNKEFTKNLDNLLNYNCDENSDFNEYNKKFEGLLKSIGYGNGKGFEANFNPWGEDDSYLSN